MNDCLVTLNCQLSRRFHNTLYIFQFSSFPTFVFFFDSVKTNLTLPESDEKKSTIQDVASTNKRTWRPLPASYLDSWKCVQEERVRAKKALFVKFYLNRGGQHYLFRTPRGCSEATLVKILKSFYRGEKKWFEETEIYKLGNTKGRNGTWAEYPVIYLDFKKILGHPDKTLQGIMKTFTAILRRIYQEFNIDHHTYTSTDYNLKTLIKKLKKKFDMPVIVLVEPCRFGLDLKSSFQFSNKCNEDLKIFIDEFFSPLINNPHCSATAPGAVGCYFIE